MNDRIHFHEINADSFECYRKFHLRSLCLLKFFFSGFEDSEHILTPSALYVGLGAGSKAQQFAQMMAIGRKKGVPNKTTALKDTILKAAECADGAEGMVGRSALDRPTYLKKNPAAHTLHTGGNLSNRSRSVNGYSIGTTCQPTTTSLIWMTGVWSV